MSPQFLGASFLDNNGTEFERIEEYVEHYLNALETSVGPLLLDLDLEYSYLDALHYGLARLTTNQLAGERITTFCSRFTALKSLSCNLATFSFVKSLPDTLETLFVSYHTCQWDRWGGNASGSEEDDESEDEDNDEDEDDEDEDVWGDEQIGAWEDETYDGQGLPEFYKTFVDVVSRAPHLKVINMKLEGEALGVGGECKDLKKICEEKGITVNWELGIWRPGEHILFARVLLKFMLSPLLSLQSQLELNDRIQDAIGGFTWLREAAMAG